MDSKRLLERFLHYVTIDTTANDQTTSYPSSQGQWELGKLLVDQLQRCNISNAHQDQFGLVHATVPASESAYQHAPQICFNSHLDTSPETTGKQVKPQVIRDYSGGDIPLPARPEKVIRVAENPELDQLHGTTLITTDGTTLLGGDDKAGLAIIMELVERLHEKPTTPHGPLRILFTCDEEIGRGVDHVDVSALQSKVAYTLDGPGAGNIDVETFSADLVTVTIQGVNIHPAIAKGRMVNALKVAANIISRLPSTERTPETTSDRQGFLHPYWIEGGVGEVRLKILLRDFDTPRLREHEAVIQQAITQTQREFSQAQFNLHVDSQYRNLADGLAGEPRAIKLAEQAYQQLDLPVKQTIIRGGTDGSRLTELGLPTPNLSSGQHNPHSVLEWACLDEMEQAVCVTMQLCELWAREH